MKIPVNDAEPGPISRAVSCVALRSGVELGASGGLVGVRLDVRRRRRGRRERAQQSNDRAVHRLAVLHPRNAGPIHAEVFGHLILGPSEARSETAQIDALAHVGECA